MDTTRIIRGNCERVASSGMTFNGKSTGQSNIGNSNKLNGILLRLIEKEMELSFRSQNCLNHAGIRLIGQLVQKYETQLLNLNNFGRTSLREIINVLSDMNLTLEMNLDFPPWNGDGNGAELIQILSAQCKGVGFQVNHEIAGILGIDFDKLEIEALKINKNVTVDKFLLLSTAVIIQYLEKEFGKGSPYLSDVIQRNKKWLQKEMKQDVTDILSKQFKMIQGGYLK